MPKRKDIMPYWVEKELDEHMANYNPHDPMTWWEVAWCMREIKSSDMDWPEEFLRRTK